MQKYIEIYIFEAWESPRLYIQKWPRMGYILNIILQGFATATLPSTGFAPSPCQHQPRTQLLAPPIPISPGKARGVGLALSTTGSLVWGAKERPIKKQRDGWGLDLRWPRFDKKQQQSTTSWHPWWEGCQRGGTRWLERVGGHCLIVPGNDWNATKINK